MWQPIQPIMPGEEFLDEEADDEEDAAANGIGATSIWSPSHMLNRAQLLERVAQLEQRAQGSRHNEPGDAFKSADATSVDLSLGPLGLSDRDNCVICQAPGIFQKLFRDTVSQYQEPLISATLPMDVATRWATMAATTKHRNPEGAATEVPTFAQIRHHLGNHPTQEMADLQLLKIATHGAIVLGKHMIAAKSDGSLQFDKDWVKSFMGLTSTWKGLKKATEHARK